MPNIKTEETFTVQFDFVIQKYGANFSRTLNQHEIFSLVKKQIKAAFDSEGISRTENYKIGRTGLKRSMRHTAGTSGEAASIIRRLKDGPLPKDNFQGQEEILDVLKKANITQEDGSIVSLSESSKRVIEANR